MPTSQSRRIERCNPALFPRRHVMRIKIVYVLVKAYRLTESPVLMWPSVMGEKE